MKRILLAAVVFCSFGFIGTASATFVDVGLSHPYKAAIEKLQEAGIVQGNPDGTFRPDAVLNRAEFTKIVIESLLDSSQRGLQNKGGDVGNCFPPGKFLDVSPDAWYATYVCNAYGKNMIGGYPDGSFRAENSINYAEAAKIVATAFVDGSIEINPSQPWYQAYIYFLKNRHAVPGTLQYPTSSVKRGEMAFMIAQLLSGEEQVAEQNADGIDPDLYFWKTEFFPEDAKETHSTQELTADDSATFMIGKGACSVGPAVTSGKSIWKTITCSGGVSVRQDGQPPVGTQCYVDGAITSYERGVYAFYENGVKRPEAVRLTCDETANMQQPQAADSTDNQWSTYSDIHHSFSLTLPSDWRQLDAGMQQATPIEEFGGIDRPISYGKGGKFFMSVSVYEPEEKTSLAGQGSWFQYAVSRLFSQQKMDTTKEEFPEYTTYQLIFRDPITIEKYVRLYEFGDRLLVLAFVQRDATTERIENSFSMQ